MICSKYKKNCKKNQNNNNNKHQNNPNIFFTSGWILQANNALIYNNVFSNGTRNTYLIQALKNCNIQ